MKKSNRSYWKIFVLALLFFAALDAMCQTKIRGLKIVSNKSYEILIQKEDSTWMDIQDEQCSLEYEWGWYYNQEISIDLRPEENYTFAFVTCNDSTFVDLCATKERFVLKGGELELNGETIKIGGCLD